MKKQRIGFIGMGLMGVPMASRLLAAGYPLTVWNRNPDKTRPLAELGAYVAGALADLVKASDILMTCVSDTAAVEAVVFGSDGIAVNGRAGQILVDFSSIDPAATRDMAENCSTPVVSNGSIARYPAVLPVLNMAHWP